MAILSNLEPKRVFEIFEEMCAIPHGSTNTKAISDWCVAFGEKLGLEHYQDEANNVILIAPATPGYEDAPAVILQGHVDMVCEKEAGCAKDMDKEGLDLFVDGDLVGAKGTTLGGDDGIAVAMALAALEDTTVQHPRLEVVLTTEEEIGMLGAAVLAVGMAGKVQTRIGGHEGYTFVPELGGWIGDQAEKLATEKELTAGKRLFGTYSSALEAMTGQLQPTGTDYIIHALGDRQRLAYLQTFQQGNFDIVVTPSPKVAPPERWSRNANWWFYRELYRYWQPVANTFQSGGMHLFWERTGTDNNLNVETTTAATLQGDGTVLVTVTAADADFCGVADVTLHYGLVSSDSMDHPFDRQFLHVTCVTENELCAAAERDTNQGDFYLPTDRDSYEVPITISNGVGQILLTAKSGSGTVYPQVNAVEVNATYQDWEYFFE